jgi:rhamnogalacturonyl hydrolase YesR
MSQSSALLVPARSVLLVALLAAACGTAAEPGGTDGSAGSSAMAGGGAAAGGVAAGGGAGTQAAAGSSSGSLAGGAGTAGASAGTGGTAAGGGGLGGSSGAGGGAATLSPVVLAQMRKVADWELPRAGASKDWIHGALWTGVFATYEVTKDDKYLSAIKTWAGAGWGLTGGAAARGDNQCAAQTFFDVYLLDPRPENMAVLNGAKPSFDAMLTENRTGRVEWWWEDALFMVPPGFARLGAITKDTAYFDKMNALYWDTYAFLWSKDAGLMYRDDTLRKDFWARGNGWVIAGAARVLEYLPENDAHRADFVKLLQTMAASLKAAQGADGLWRASLLNPNQIPNPETSGTGFFTYGIAYGINHGFLDSASYLPVVQKGWAGLNTHVDADGKLGYVQPVGAGPAAAPADSTVEYGVGAFLLAGSEAAKLLP